MYVWPVRHSNDNAVHTSRTHTVNHLLHCWNQNLATLQSEALLRRPFLCEVLLEISWANQTLHQCSLLVSWHIHDARHFETFLQPIALLEVVDKHELDTNVSTVYVLHNNGQLSVYSMRGTIVGLLTVFKPKQRFSARTEQNRNCNFLWASIRVSVTG